MEDTRLAGGAADAAAPGAPVALEPAPTVATQAWDVKITMITGKLSEALTKLGQDGWEPWGFLGMTQGPNPAFQIGIKRPTKKLVGDAAILADLSGTPRDLRGGS